MCIALLQQELDVGFGMGGAALDHGALIGGWQVRVAHLHGGADRQIFATRVAPAAF